MYLCEYKYLSFVFFYKVQPFISKILHFHMLYKYDLSTTTQQQKPNFKTKFTQLLIVLIFLNKCVCSLQKL